MFYFTDFYGKKVLKSSMLDDLNCFFTTRNFVLTSAALTNLSQAADENLNFLQNKLNSKVIKANQVHGSNIEIVDSEHYFYDNTDSLISNIQNSILMMNFADCTPIILYSRNDNTGAIVHAGWRGTALKIVQKTIQKMKNELNINPKNITALIGPTISKCCFETDEEVFNQLVDDKSKSELFEKKNGKYFIDLKLLNKNQLQNEGVNKIDVCTYCTFCMSDIFFSYRKEKGITARHSAILQIREDKTCQ